jgi:ABC-type multidrug transport system ATPase subunit
MALVDVVDVAEHPLVAFTYAADAGIHLFLADREAGAATLIELVSGVRRPRRGRVLVSGADPSRSPATRQRIGSVFHEEPAAEHTSVAAALRAEYRLRRVSIDANAVLEEWGLSRLALLPPAALDPGERRAVALVSALSLPEVTILAVAEPLHDIGGIPRGRVADRLREVAATACVFCTTAVPRDAAELGGTVSLLRQGRLAPAPMPFTEPLGALAGYLMIRCERPRDLVHALSENAAVSGVKWDESAGNQVFAWSDRAEPIALAVGQAIAQSRCGLISLSPARPSLDLLQTAQDSWTRAIYAQTAWMASRAVAPPVPSYPAQPPPGSTVQPAPDPPVAPDTRPVTRPQDEEPKAQ